ncbi:hypothetical protein Pmani_036186 [Petrolisthes manimaculis]|uniref:Uncharacterized protein n=1 Tax=Petrolisthes manimaculis TaxID=1843537 RepID=A0AAE1NK52_9EUCA|nr:hypothetical protein Pmani_036186 [Petrolisthes manimaculis]
MEAARRAAADTEMGQISAVSRHRSSANERRRQLMYGTVGGARTSPAPTSGRHRPSRPRQCDSLCPSGRTVRCAALR